MDNALTTAALDRFYNKTTPTHDGSGCILWTACLQPNGYGKLGVAYRTVLAHRWIYEQTHGVTLERDELVLHSCDTRNCVNVDHLRVGTYADNAADMDSRGRRVIGVRLRGERQPGHRLTEAKVRDVRRRYAEGGTTLDELAAEHGVARNAIWLVVKGRTWKHVA